MRSFLIKYLLLLCIIQISCIQTAVSQTASKRMLILDSVDMKSLNRTTTVRIYLPPSYHKKKRKRFPVLYMLDGQNLFDVETSYIGEWEVDETLDSLSKSDNLDIIVVGIDNAKEKRHLEYSVWPNPKYGGGEGYQFLKFITDELKPMIDRNLRTKSNAKNTGILGSSLGGLIAHYAFFTEKNTFGTAGIFSPAYWFNETEIFEMTSDATLFRNQKAYMIIGEKEGDQHVENFQLMVKKIKISGIKEENIKSKIIEGGEHNEKLWKFQLTDALIFMYNN